MPRSSEKSGASEKKEEAQPELKWFSVRSSSGNHSYRAADAAEARGMHERTVPADTIIEVVEQL